MKKNTQQGRADEGIKIKMGRYAQNTDVSTDKSRTEMEKVYLSARYGRILEMRELVEKLRKLGYEVTSRWLEKDPGCNENDMTADEIAEIVKENMEDLLAADTVVCFTEFPDGSPGQARGGRHVEAGMAIAWNKHLIVVGVLENAFYRGCAHERYHTSFGFLEACEDGRKAA